MMMRGIVEWVSDASNVEFWGTIGVFVIFALAGLVAALIGFRRARTILDVPTARVRSAPQGYVELQGTAHANRDALVCAPLTGRACLWYDYKVERKQRSGKKTTWRTVRKGRCNESFLIRDGTGQCVIFPEGAAITPESTECWYGNSEWPDTQPQAGVQSDKPGGFSIAVAGFEFGARRYRYTEKRIHDGDPLYSIGWFKTVNPGDEMTLIEETRAALGDLKQDRPSMLKRFDANSDGDINIEEWDAARKTVQREVIAARSKRSATEEAVHTMTKPSQRRQPYLLSTRPEAQLVRYYRTMSALGGVLVVGFGILSLIFVQLRI